MNTTELRKQLQDAIDKIDALDEPKPVRTYLSCDRDGYVGVVSCEGTFLVEFEFEPEE